MADERRLLGTDFPIAEAARILRALQFTVEPAGGDTLRVTTPPHRRDIQAGSADLIEELARVYGYDRLPATLLADQLPEQHANRPLEFEERLRDILVNCGLQEVITYALTEPERDAPVGLGEGKYVELLNPISSERRVMRHSVLGGVLEVAVANLRHTDDVRLFEIGSVYLSKEGQKLPDEPRRLALLLTGRRHLRRTAAALRLRAGAALPGGTARRGGDRGRECDGRARRGGDSRRRRRPAARRAPVRPVPRREHPGGQEEPGLRADVPGRRP